MSFWKVFAALVLLVVFSVAEHLFMRFGNSELNEKSAWALLQGVESQHRNDVDRDKPLLISNANNSGYSVLGIPTANIKYPRAWILLDEQKPSVTVKIVPQGEVLKLSCTYLSSLKNSMTLAPPVYEYLLNVCQN